MSQHNPFPLPRRSKSYDGTGEIVYRFNDGQEPEEGQEQKGWTIRTVASKGDLQTEDMLMGHGSFCSTYNVERHVEKGMTRIFSLRDPQNQPHATIQLAGVKNEIEEIWLKENEREQKYRKGDARERRERLKEWFHEIDAFKVFRNTGMGDEEDITYRVWEQYDVNEASFAISDYYHQEYEEPVADDEEYDVPILQEIGWDDPNDVLEAVIDKYEQNFKSANDLENMYAEYHQRRIEGLDEKWAENLSSSLVDQCKRGKIGESSDPTSINKRKKDLFERAAKHYYALYQVNDETGDWSDNGWRDEYIESHGEMFTELEFTHDNLPRDYALWAQHMVQASPILQLCRAIIEKLGYPVFPLED